MRAQPFSETHRRVGLRDREANEQSNVLSTLSRSLFRSAPRRLFSSPPPPPTLVFLSPPLHHRRTPFVTRPGMLVTPSRAFYLTRRRSSPRAFVSPVGLPLDASMRGPSRSRRHMHVCCSTSPGCGSPGARSPLCAPRSAGARCNRLAPAGRSCRCGCPCRRVRTTEEGGCRLVDGGDRRLFVEDGAFSRLCSSSSCLCARPSRGRPCARRLVGRRSRPHDL